MQESRIYFVETDSGEQRRLLCQWVESFFEQGCRVHVIAGSTMAAQHLDQLLWTFSEGSFVPHRILSSGRAESIVEPVAITSVGAPLEGFDAVVFDGDMDLDVASHYETAVHFVLRDDAEKRQESRLLWQAARDGGFDARHTPHASNTKFPRVASRDSDKAGGDS